MNSQKLPCQTLPPWLRNNLGRDCLAPLTGFDRRCLLAAVMIVDAYSVADRRQVDDLLHAFRLVVCRMQEKTWPLAYHAIAHVLDWPDRERLWAAAGLPHLLKPSRCAYEPGGSAR